MFSVCSIGGALSDSSDATEPASVSVALMLVNARPALVLLAKDWVTDMTERFLVSGRAKGFPALELECHCRRGKNKHSNSAGPEGPAEETL
jgi:hypothetical protein